MLDPSDITFRPARREDVAALVQLIADDDLGAEREQISDPLPAKYFEAFERIVANPRALLAVAEATQGDIIGTLQMTFITGLSNQGAEVALVSAVRIASTQRGRGLGQAMMQWAMHEAQQRGCRQIELFTHASRLDAQRFYERLGFVRSHAGMRRPL